MTISEQELLARLGRVTSVRLERWVGHGWIKPSEAGGQRIYAAVDISRCDLICDLVDHLDIGEDAVPVVLGLLDQVYGLRQELRSMVDAIDRQPEAVRQAILESLALRPGGPAAAA